jgi:hypothetical protein
MRLEMRLTTARHLWRWTDPSDLTFRLGGWESDQGCRRRPMTKYEIGETPIELTSATTMAHTVSGPGSGSKVGA